MTFQRFTVWHTGDRTVGDYGRSAEVQMDVVGIPAGLVEEQLAECFGAIWDVAPAHVHVILSDELEGGDDGDDDG